MENSEKIVSMVMEEYDVIEEEPTKDCAMVRKTSQQRRRLDSSGVTRNSESDESSGVLNTRADSDQRTLETGENVDNPDSTEKETGEGGRLKVSEDVLSEGDNPIYELLCPRVNCPEKIVICLDFSSEMDKLMFRTRAGDKFAPLMLLKRALGFYLHSKHKLDSRHEFALMLLQDTAIWVRDFTTDPREIINLLEDLEDTGPCESCDMASVFQCVYDHVEMPTVDGDPLILPPPYTVRVLLLYGRSHCTLELAQKEAQRSLFSSPYFFVDAFYIHETPSEENKCEEIFDSLCDLDQKGFSYIFEASRNPTKIYDYMAQLIAHPLQRPGQKETSYKIQLRSATE